MKDALKLMVLQLLRGYKWAISPLFLPSCRYVPTCSEYAMEAIELHGVPRGSAMALARLLRCHPFVKGGFDPVVKPACVESHCSASSRRLGKTKLSARQSLASDGMVH
jgi:putative membrane protein insertion efficiency factor